MSSFYRWCVTLLASLFAWSGCATTPKGETGASEGDSNETSILSSTPSTALHPSDEINTDSGDGVPAAGSHSGGASDELQNTASGSDIIKDIANDHQDGRDGKALNFPLDAKDETVKSPEEASGKSKISNDSISEKPSARLSQSEKKEVGIEPNGGQGMHLITKDSTEANSSNSQPSGFLKDGERGGQSSDLPLNSQPSEAPGLSLPAKPVNDSFDRTVSHQPGLSDTLDGQTILSPLGLGVRPNGNTKSAGQAQSEVQLEDEAHSGDTFKPQSLSTVRFSEEEFLRSGQSRDRSSVSVGFSGTKALRLPFIDKGKDGKTLRFSPDSQEKIYLRRPELNNEPLKETFPKDESKSDDYGSLRTFFSPSKEARSIDQPSGSSSSEFLEAEKFLDSSTQGKRGSVSSTEAEEGNPRYENALEWLRSRGQGVEKEN